MLVSLLEYFVQDRKVLLDILRVMYFSVMKTFYTRTLRQPGLRVGVRRGRNGEDPVEDSSRIVQL